jgi:hypothetical protein
MSRNPNNKYFRETLSMEGLLVAAARERAAALKSTVLLKNALNDDPAKSVATRERLRHPSGRVE